MGKKLTDQESDWVRVLRFAIVAGGAMILYTIAVLVPSDWMLAPSAWVIGLLVAEYLKDTQLVRVIRWLSDHRTNSK